MLKNVLKTIKVDMRETRSNKKYMQAMLKAELAKLEIRRQEALAENNDIADEDSRSWLNRQVNKAYNSRRQDVINDVFSRWHNDQSYYLIYKDGSEVYITAEDILNGDPFPKMPDIVYAEMSSAYDHMDTETGDLHWYSDEHMESCDWNYEVEDERKWQYDTAIQFKYGTEWSRQWFSLHPDFVPQPIVG